MPRMQRRRIGTWLRSPPCPIPAARGIITRRRLASIPPTSTACLTTAGFRRKPGSSMPRQAAYTSVIAMTKPGTDDYLHCWAQLGIGDIQKQRGNLAAAITTYRDAQDFADRLAKFDSNNALWQHVL